MCSALQGVALCTKCVGVQVDKIISACINHGGWHKVFLTEHCRQVLNALSENKNCIVDPDTGMVCHVFAHKLLQASKKTATSVSGWTVQEREYAAKHCSKARLWYHPRQKMLRRITPLRLYDKQSILAHMQRNNTLGVGVTEIVKEYEGAHLDVLDLLNEKKLLLYANTLWLARSSTTS